MTKQELDISKQDMDNKIKDTMRTIREYEHKHVAYKMSLLSVKVGDKITLGGVDYYFGGYVLSDVDSHMYTVVARKPITTLFKIKKNGESYKSRIHVYHSDAELLTKYGKE